MDMAKLLASFLVVFVHAPFPGKLGAFFQCMGRGTVPLFLAISGYFNFHATPEKIKKRLIHILKLNVAALLVHVLWGCFVTEINGESTISYLRALSPNAGWLVRLLFLFEHPFLEYRYEHLWYLLAIGLVYVVYYLYSRFFDGREPDYRPLYLVSAVFLVIHTLLDEFAAVCGAVFPIYIRRSLFVYCLPFFALGIFIRQYQERIISAFSLNGWKLLLLAAGSLAFSMTEYQLLGLQNLYIGTMLAVPSILLLTAACPHPVKKKTIMVSAFDKWSTWIYILHMIVLEGYRMFFYEPLAACLGPAEPWLFPLIVLGVSFVLAVCAVWVQKLGKHIRKK